MVKQSITILLFIRFLKFTTTPHPKSSLLLTIFMRRPGFKKFIMFFGNDIMFDKDWRRISICCRKLKYCSTSFSLSISIDLYFAS